jgi:putative nucleotidyltransferase with HDIG domain
MYIFLRSLKDIAGGKQMIRKVNINELEKGMYVSGFEKEGAANALFFMNSLLVRNKRDLEKFLSYGYRSAYVVVDEPDEVSMPDKRHWGGHGDADGLESGQGEKGCPEEGPLEADAFEGAGPEYVERDTEKGRSAGVVDVSDESDLKQEAHQRCKDGAEENFRHKAAPGSTPEIKNVVEFSEEIKAAKTIRSEAEGLAREFMTAAHLKDGIDTDRVNTTVEKMVESILRNGDALTSLVRIKSADDYTFSHCVNVAVLAVTIGRQLGLSKSELYDLGVGAMLHDVGKALVSQEVLKKPGPLTSREFDEIKRHAELSAELLARTEGIEEDAVSAALQHHEKFDGTGYPHQLAGEEIHLYARIMAVADAYDAMTSNRVYQKKLQPDIVLQKMYIWKDANFESTLVERLIKCLGIYPIGTVVELNTGEIAVVKSTNHSNPLQPTLLLLFDEDRAQVPEPYEVDLRNEVARWVVRSHDPNKLGVKIDPIIA